MKCIVVVFFSIHCAFANRHGDRNTRIARDPVDVNVGLMIIIKCFLKLVLRRNNGKSVDLIDGVLFFFSFFIFAVPLYCVPMLLLAVVANEFSYRRFRDIKKKK